MKTLKPEIGARIRITEGDEPFYEAGDFGILTHQDPDGDWWATIDTLLGHHNWCAGPESDFEVVEPAPVKDQNPKQGKIAIFRNGLQGILSYKHEDGSWAASFGKGTPQNIGFEGSDFLIYDPENPVESRADFDLVICKSVRGE